MTDGVSSFDQTIYNGILPRKLLVFLIAENQYDCGLKMNPFLLRNFGMSSIQLKKDGLAIPSQPLSYDFTNNKTAEAYNHMLEHLHLGRSWRWQLLCTSIITELLLCSRYYIRDNWSQPWWMARLLFFHCFCSHPIPWWCVGTFGKRSFALGNQMGKSADWIYQSDDPIWIRTRHLRRFQAVLLARIDILLYICLHWLLFSCAYTVLCEQIKLYI